MNETKKYYPEEVITEIDFSKNIINVSTQKLCEIVVSSRYLGALKKEAIISMEELARRRSLGDQFNYEEFIEIELKKLPSYNLDINSILSLKKLKGFLIK